jgi:putative ABC transport system permease protein
MKIVDLTSLSWNMVLRNRKRYVNVMVAIAVGTFLFIIIRTLGDAVEHKISEDLEAIGGATVLTADWHDRLARYHVGEYYLKDTQQLRQIPGVFVVAPVRRTGRDQELQYGKTKRKETQLTFVDQNYWLTQSTTLSGGRLINQEDVMRMKKVCVIGKDIRNELFAGVDDPLGKKLCVDAHEYEVIGTLGGIQPDFVSKSIFIPLSLAGYHLSGVRQFVLMFIRVDTYANIESVGKQAKQVLALNHPEYADGIRVLVQDYRLDRVKFVTFLVKSFIYAALVGIFLLGKIGLTNIMLSAVQDRTREIGLRKAVGATDELIRAQFIMEAIFVSSLAGIIGTLVGIVSVYILRYPLGVEISYYVMSLSIWLDMFFTLAVGIAAGFYPALQASRLDVVTAMRFE